MKRLILAFCGLLLIGGGAQAQLSGGMMFPGPGMPASAGGGGFTGIGDIVSGWQVVYSLRAFTAAKRGTKAINVCNASDVTCVDFLTDATTGALVITTVGGTDCSVSTCTIKTWYDWVGTQCTGACDNTQGTIATRATLKTTCPGLSTPCAQYTTSQNYTGPSLASTVNQPYSMTAVYNRYSGTAYGGLLAFSSPDSRFAVEGAANQIQLYTGAVLDATATDATFIIANGLFSNTPTTCIVNVNGTETGPTSCGSNGAGGTPVLNQVAGQSANLYVMETGMTTTAETLTNRNVICHNQKTFFGITASC